MASQTWIEVALNGPWGRERQPGIPIAPEQIIAEGVAAAQAGAAIIHLHAYDPSTGRQNDDAETYARIFEGIREKADALIYPDPARRLLPDRLCGNSLRAVQACAVPCRARADRDDGGGPRQRQLQPA
jgi:hypothetical protein